MTERKPSNSRESGIMDDAPKSTRKRIVDAVKRKDLAESHARWADAKAERGDRIGALAAHHDANKLREQADADLSIWAHTTRTPKRGNGGELVPLFEPEDSYRRDIKRMTVEDAPDALTHQASSDAMDLAIRADVLPGALEMASSIKARNRIEQTLAHEMAAVHALGMKFVQRANDELSRAEKAALGGNREMRVTASVEAQRMGNAAARAFSSFQDAALTLQRLRTGGKQIVKVVHQQVQVNDGGKAVVAGNLKHGRKTGGKGKGIKSK